MYLFDNYFSRRLRVAQKHKHSLHNLILIFWACNYCLDLCYKIQNESLVYIARSDSYKKLHAKLLSNSLMKYLSNRLTNEINFNKKCVFWIELIKCDFRVENESLKLVAWILSREKSFLNNLNRSSASVNVRLWRNLQLI